VNNPTIGWFISSPPCSQGRVGVAPNTATQVKLGQFMLSEGSGARPFSLRTAWNNGAGGGVVFSDGTFTVCPGNSDFPDIDSDGFGDSAASALYSRCAPRLLKACARACGRSS